MRKPGAKQVITPREPLEISAQRRAGEHLPVTQEITGSNPVALGRSAKSSVSEDDSLSESPDKAGDHITTSAARGLRRTSGRYRPSSLVGPVTSKPESLTNPEPVKRK